MQPICCSSVYMGVTNVLARAFYRYKPLYRNNFSDIRVGWGTKKRQNREEGGRLEAKPKGEKKALKTEQIMCWVMCLMPPGFSSLKKTQDNE